jgi:hypothetical protein
MPKSSLSQSTGQALSSRRRRRPRQTSLTKRLTRHTKVLELCARLGVNGLLTVVALAALVRLVPYVQSKAAQLTEVNQALSQAEASTAKLKSDFGRYFDPWQAESIMQEQSGYRPPSERQVVWTQDEKDITTTPIENTEEPLDAEGANISEDPTAPVSTPDDNSTSEASSSAVLSETGSENSP